MGDREEEKQKSNCSNRRLGLAAAAAIGVGVGAALYYLFNKRDENPHGEGSSSSAGWTYEEHQAFCVEDSDDEESHLTTEDIINLNSDESISEHHDEDMEYTINSDFSGHTDEASDGAYESDFTNDTDSETSREMDYDSVSLTGSDLDSLDNSFDRPRPEETEDTTQRAQVFRERSWSLEECSICCDVMLIDHQVQMLACGHKFHSNCVQPWLDEQKTCPNCRKTA